MKRRIFGVIPPIVTPFTRTHEIDEGALKSVTQFLLEAGVNGIVTCGSTGEFALMSLDERKRVTEIVLEVVGNQVPVIEGVTAVRTEDAMMLANHAKDLGLDAVLAAPPYYYKIEEKELYSYYSGLARVDIPIIVYNNPGTTKLDMSPDFISRLASDFDNIDYVKESTGDAQRVSDIEWLTDKIEVICGWDPLIYDFLTHGVKSWIATVANVIPRHCVDLVGLAAKNDFGAARQLFYKLFPLIKLIDGPKFVQCAKAGLKLVGQNSGFLRNPLQPLGDNELRHMKELLGELQSSVIHV